MLGRASAALAFVVGLATMVYAGACLRIGPMVHYQLLARTEGRLVVLLETTDRSEFEQVCRGLRRALEFRDDTP